jgi:Protein of unknown function (DUF3179)
MRLVAALLFPILLLAGCGGGSGEDSTGPADNAGAGTYDYPPAPAVEGAPLEPRVEAALSTLSEAALAGDLDRAALDTIASSRDPRFGWLISDYLRFAAGEAAVAFVAAFEGLTGVDPRRDPAFAESPWLSVTNHLIAWELPAPPGYRERKAELFLAIEPAWSPFFEDPDSEIDWRLVSWGGVQIDARPLGDPAPCPHGCIPALDDPALTSAADGDWYPDERTVFGVRVGGQAVAFPKNVMEVHELVNVTIGGRRLGIPYCTLCGSAQAYFLDSVPAGIEVPVLRTSGLLSRSNKMMYDLRSWSAFDTFTGEAVSGPLQDARVRLAQTTVVASSWGDWKEEHPETLIVAEDGGIGRAYPADPLAGRDDEGPIFPVGDVDPRLPVQEQVVGVITPEGRALAFPAEAARSELESEEEIVFAGAVVTADGGGLRVRAIGGRELPAHQAFWFAWSQFHPRTAVWRPR